MKSVSYPVSFQCSQHLLSQLDLSRDLIDTVTAAKEWLEETGKEAEVEERVRKEKGRNCKREGGRKERCTHTYSLNAAITVEKNSVVYYVVLTYFICIHVFVVLENRIS